MPNSALFARSTDCRPVGLLGGSFNPAHEGHIQISFEGLKRLGLTEVIWLVTPRNPHKSLNIYLPFSARIKIAQSLAQDYNFITVSDLEYRINSRYTYDTIEYLKRIYTQKRFIWLMGADNIPNIHKWHKWRELLHSLEFAVFDREPYSYSIDSSRFSLNCPKAYFFRIRKNPISSSIIRNKLVAFHPD